jgi:hypothetical protein
VGVYHFMGLGRSPGAVTAAISYLADRYARYDPTDRAFFARSGESRQTSKRGDAQAIVLFSTPEVLEGRPEGLSERYKENAPGSAGGTLRIGNEALPKLLKKKLATDLKHLAGGRQQVSLFWCEVDLEDIHLTFERVARVMYAAKPPGEVGKEIWVNLTGGANTLNLSLQLAASLLGHPARLYYLLSKDRECLRHTTPGKDLGTERDHFWVDVPVIYLRMDPAIRKMLELLEAEAGPIEEQELLSRLKADSAHWTGFQSADLQAFRRAFLQPLSGTVLERIDSQRVAVGKEWAVLKDYYQVVSELVEGPSVAERSLESLAKAQLGTAQPWFQQDSVAF